MISGGWRRGRHHWSAAGFHSGNAEPRHYVGGQGNRGGVGVTELAARIRAVLRRGSQSARARLQVEDLVMDRLSPSVHRSGHAIALSPKELSLLEFLMRHSGHPVSHWLSKSGRTACLLTTTQENAKTGSVARTTQKRPGYRNRGAPYCKLRCVLARFL